jgi:hypothetical protein
VPEGRLTVETRAEYEAWLEKLYKEKVSHQPRFRWLNIQ